MNISENSEGVFFTLDTREVHHKRNQIPTVSLSQKLSWLLSVKKQWFASYQGNVVTGTLLASFCQKTNILIFNPFYSGTEGHVSKRHGNLLV